MKIQLRHISRAFWLLILIVGMVDVNHAYGSANNVNQAVVKPFPNIGPINRGFVKHIIDGGEHSGGDDKVERDSWHFSESVHTNDEDADKNVSDEKKGNSLPHSKGGPVPSLPLNKEQSKVKIITTDEDAEYRFPDDDNRSDDDTVPVASSSSSIKITISESNNEKKKEKPAKNDKHAVIDEESVQDNEPIGVTQTSFSLHLMGQGKYSHFKKVPFVISYK